MKTFFSILIILSSMTASAQFNFWHTSLTSSKSPKLTISCIDAMSGADLTMDLSNIVLQENSKCFFTNRYVSLASLDLTFNWMNVTTGSTFSSVSALDGQNRIPVSFGICGYNTGDISGTATIVDNSGRKDKINLTVQCPKNSWGSGVDGSLTYATSANLCTEDSSNATCVKQYKNLTINAGVTLSTAVAKKGLIIYVNGDATINGSIVMSARGVGGDVGSDLVFARVKNGGGTSGSSSVGAAANSTLTSIESFQSVLSTNKTGYLYSLTRSGRNGATQVSAGSYGQTTGGTGTAGYSNTSRALSSGGGGGGGAAGGNGSASYGGAGSYGSPFSGGSGGGGGACRDGAYAASLDGQPAVAYGGSGGTAGYNNNQANFSDQVASGGAGNPGGLVSSGRAGTPSVGFTGTGGTIILFVKGKLTVGGGTFVSAGSSGGSSSGSGNWSAVGGGGSGGGNILILSAGEQTGLSNGSFNVSGGAAGTGTGKTYKANGGAGGAGSYYYEIIDK